VINPNQGDQTRPHAESGEGHAGNLTLRVMSALVLAPVALLGAFADGWTFLGLCAVAAGGILWEWTLLVARRADPRILVPGLAALLAGMVLAGLALPQAALGAIAGGALLAGVAAAVWKAGYSAPSMAAWAAGGVVYAGALLLGLALLRRDPEWGLTALLFLFATVWATDIFAFFCGRALGGPLLWPRVSPKKTWSGAIGGLVGGVAAGVAVAYASGIAKLGTVGAMALLLCVLAQAGDLLESAVKRRFGAKDASHLIPGHGGLMDRLDGLLVAAAAAVLIGILRQGTAAPARGLLIW
jgi:phosphatidate cytidylyltransferase